MTGFRYSRRPVTGSQTLDLLWALSMSEEDHVTEDDLDRLLENGEARLYQGWLWARQVAKGIRTVEGIALDESVSTRAVYRTIARAKSEFATGRRPCAYRGCKRLLPVGSTSRRQYCGDGCRTRARRLRASASPGHG